MGGRKRMIAGEKQQVDENKEKCSPKDEAWTRNSSMFRHKMFLGNENEVILCLNVDLCVCLVWIRNWIRTLQGPFWAIFATSSCGEYVFLVLFRLPITNSFKTTVRLFICRKDDAERGKGAPERTAYRTMDLSNYRSLEL